MSSNGWRDYAPRSGAPRTIDLARVDAVIARTLESMLEGAAHWSTCTMARDCGMSQTAVSRIWRAFGLRSCRQATFKLSSDPMFVEKVRDIVGLYLPRCCSSTRRTGSRHSLRPQSVLPLVPGIPERRTHDYERYGAITQFAALDIASGSVIGDL
jgi:hypothetical protein